MSAIIIGLTGPAGSGKDTVAFFLNGFQRYSLAYPIKAGLCAMFDLSMNDLNDRDKKEVVIPHIGKSPRELMQTLGTEWGRQHVGPDIWVKLMLRRWGEIRSQPAPVNMVVTDVRFDNEATAIIEAGGTIWGVVRDASQPVARHASENGVSAALIKGVIVNNGSMSDLRKQCDTMLKVLKALQP